MQDTPEKPDFLDEVPRPGQLERDIDGFPYVSEIRLLAAGFSEEYDCETELRRDISQETLEKIREHPEARTRIDDEMLEHGEVGLYIFRYDFGDAHGWFDRHVVGPLPSLIPTNSGHDGVYKIPVFLD